MKYRIVQQDENKCFKLATRLQLQVTSSNLPNLQDIQELENKKKCCRHTQLFTFFCKSAQIYLVKKTLDVC